MKNANLHKLLNKKSKNPVLNVRDHPYVSTSINNLQMQLIWDKFFKKLPGYKWGFHKLEFQHRGTVHAHGFVRIEIEGDRQIEDYARRAREIRDYIIKNPDLENSEKIPLLEEKK